MIFCARALVAPTNAPQSRALGNTFDRRRSPQPAKPGRSQGPGNTSGEHGLPDRERHVDRNRPIPALFSMEPTGLEPVTSCLQIRRRKVRARSFGDFHSGLGL
jgi:hypothetical protein